MAEDLRHRYPELAELADGPEVYAITREIESRDLAIDRWRERAETAEREAERLRLLFLQRCSAIERARHVCGRAKARKNAPGMWLVAEQVLAALDYQESPTVAETPAQTEEIDGS